jgi:hypothetical protein
MQGPLFQDGTFEFICIPDKKRVSEHTYGNCIGRSGIPHSEFFKVRQREKVAQKHVHLDPEFETFTYGDPTSPKRSLRKLGKGDYLIFYCGLQRWDEATSWRRDDIPALYIAGYFVVEKAGMAADFDAKTLQREFGQNFHVRYPSVFQQQQEQLVLVKGGPGSRLLTKAYLISAQGINRSGKPLKVLSPAMQEVFGDFGGKVGIQRCPPRWVQPSSVNRAIDFVERLN